jgi:adenylosuccinate lyase
VVNPGALARNLALYGPFAASERVLMALVKSGADRQAMHEKLRQHALEAWNAVQAGQPNPLADRLAADPGLQQYLPETELRRLMDASQYVGDAPQRARSLAARIRKLGQ